MRLFVAPILVFSALLAGCQHPEPSAEPAASSQGPASAVSQEEEIRVAVRSYLAGRPGLSLENMEMEFGEIQVQGDQAEADVSFRSKSGQGEMSMHYTLVRQDGQWVVQKPSGGHGTGEGEMPPSHPPVQSEEPAPTQ